MSEWKAAWSGGGWALCHGEWTLYRDGKRVETSIPFATSPAETRGTYSHWYFDSGWMEEWEEYRDGLTCDEWCEDFEPWLSTLAPKEEWPRIYEAFQAEDFREQSCGGCI